MQKPETFTNKKKTSFTLSAEAYDLLTNLAQANRRDRTSELEVMIRDKAQETTKEKAGKGDGN